MHFKTFSILFSLNFFITYFRWFIAKKKRIYRVTQKDETLVTFMCIYGSDPVSCETIFILSKTIDYRINHLNTLYLRQKQSLTFRSPDTTRLSLVNKIVKKIKTSIKNPDDKKRNVFCKTTIKL